MEQTTPTVGHEDLKRVVRTSHNQLSGRILMGKYRLNVAISKGGMGAVYLARHIEHGKKCAIKILRNDLTLVPSVRERFFLEYKAATEVLHPSVARTFDVNETADGELFLVMEYVEGPSLRKMLRFGPADYEKAILISAAVASGLGAVHGKEIVHRDLKPDNILIPRRRDDSSIVKVVDFGIARFLGTPGITTTRHVLGTPGYIAPEQAAGRRVDARVDIYSLGVIMYEMLSGVLPFKGATPEEIMKKHIKKSPTPLRKQPNTRAVGSGFEKLVMGCLEKKPSNRPSSMADVTAALEKLA